MSASELASPASTAETSSTQTQHISGAICQTLGLKRDTNELLPKQNYLSQENTKELGVMPLKITIHAFEA